MYIQVHKAVDACKNVLRGLHSNRITPRELDRVSFLTKFSLEFRVCFLAKVASSFGIFGDKFVKLFGFSSHFKQSNAENNRI